MGCCSQEEGCAPGPGEGERAGDNGGLHGGGGDQGGKSGPQTAPPSPRHHPTKDCLDLEQKHKGIRNFMSFSHTHVTPLQSRWFQSPEEKSRSAGMHEKPELGKSGKNCLYSRLAFKQTQALFPFCWLWAQEPYETQTTVKEATLGIATSSKTKALGLQGSVLKPKLHENCENVKYSTCTQNQKVERNSFNDEETVSYW